MDFHRALEMTISPAEFRRFLRAVVPVFEDEGQTLRWFDGNHGRTIRLLSLPNRRMPGAVLQRHRVEITLEACAEDDGEAFMARFHRAFLRGGG